MSPLVFRTRQVVGAEPSGAGPLLRAGEVVAAFRAAGLPADDPRREPAAGGGPSGLPRGEREAWRFGVPGAAGGGRLMVFDGDEPLNRKAAWFRRVGAEGAVVAHRNVLLWLDPALDPREAARYRQALKGLR